MNNNVENEMQCTGARPKEHSEAVRESPMPGRKADRGRRVLRAESVGRAGGSDGEERGACGSDKARSVRLLLPEERSAGVPGGLAPNQGPDRR